MKTKIILLFVLCLVNLYLPLLGQQSCQSIGVTWYGGIIKCSSEDYKLVFHDEFDGSSLNPSKWYTYYPYGANASDQCEYCRTHGDERQVYKDANVSLSNGTLKLVVKQETATWYTATREHTSGMIHTKQGFKYGKFEIRCKIPSGSGFWPAFWLWGLDECDVFEFCGDNTNNFNSNLHMDCNSQHHQIPMAHSPGPDFSQNFHVFSVEWEPLYVSWYVDGQLVRKVPTLKTVAGNSVNCGDKLGVQTLIANKIIPDEYMSVIANLAVSRDNGYCSPHGVNNQTPFPSTFEIDYIRVYQKDIQSGLTDLCANKLNGDNMLCIENQYTYTYNGVNNSVDTWTTSSNLNIVNSSPTSITVSPISNSSTSGWIKASFNSSSQPCSNEVIKNVTIHQGISGFINNSQTLYTVNGVSASNINVNLTTFGNQPINWVLTSSSSGVSYSTLNNGKILNIKGLGSAVFKANSSTSCGTIIKDYVFYSYGGFYKISPNPVSNVLSIMTNFEQKNLLAQYNISKPKIKSIEIYGKEGEKYISKEYDITQDRYDIDLKGLKSGLYYVKMISEENNIVKTFMKL